MNRRSSIALIMIALLATLLTACGGSPAAQPTAAPAPSEAPAPTAAAAPTAAPGAPAAAGYPVTIENCGRTLTFEQAPERVEVTYQTVAEVLLALGVGERIVGVYYGRDLPPLPELAAADAQLTYYGDVPPREVAIANRTDLVVAGYYFDLQDSNGKSLTQAEYEANGAQVYRMTAQCTNNALAATVEDVYTDILNLGKIFGVEARAEAIVTTMRERIAAVEARVQGRPPVTALLVDGTSTGPIYVFGAGLPSQLVALAGGVNVFADSTESGFEASLEALAAESPEVIAISWYDGESIQPPRDPNARIQFLYETFPNMPAAQNQRTMLMRNGDFQANLRMPETVEALARLMHPAAFP